jgi:hypothetical protein
MLRCRGCMHRDFPARAQFVRTSEGLISVRSEVQLPRIATAFNAPALHPICRATYTERPRTRRTASEHRLALR